MMAAPALLLSSELLRALTANAPTSQMNYASQILALSALVLFIPVVIGLIRLQGHRSPAIALSGAAMALVGIVGTVSLVTYRLVLWGLERSLDAPLFVEVRRSLPAQVLIPLLAPSMFFTIGLAILAVGVYRTKVVKRWVSTVLVIAPIALLVTSIPDIRPAILVACVALLAALGAVGARLIGGDR